jgi:hypothetical protein
MDRVVLRKWLQAGFVDKGVLFPTEAGTPQGGIASPVLANLALDGLEDAVRSAIGRSANARRPAKAHVVRYADDFIVTGASREMLEQRVKPAVEEFLAARGLQLAPEKTSITYITQGFDFLGQNVRKYGDKLLIKPANKSVQALRSKVSEVLGKNKAATQAQVIMLLNPILRGWAMYHRHVVAAATFSRIDHLVWTKLWRWAKRRHPQKNAQWIKARSTRLGLRLPRPGRRTGATVRALPSFDTTHQAPHEGSQRCQSTKEKSRQPSQSNRRCRQGTLGSAHGSEFWRRTGVTAADSARDWWRLTAHAALLSNAPAPRMTAEGRQRESDPLTSRHTVGP